MATPNLYLRVKQVNGAVVGYTGNLSVVFRERHRENVLEVLHEATSGLAGVVVPETEGDIPRAGQCKLSIGTDGNVLDEVGVALEVLLWEAVRVTVIDNMGQGPHDDGLI